MGWLIGSDRSPDSREAWQELAGDHPYVAESLREVLRYRVAATLPVPGAAWPDQPAPFVSLVAKLMDAGIIDVGFAREETLREIPGVLLNGIARILGGKG